MTIYGTALLSICMLVGMVLGRLLGVTLGVDKDIGGVGIAMLMLIVGCDFLQRRGKLPPPSQAGITFWSTMYVPIVVAMAASQNVGKALAGGLIALLAGAGPVVVCFGLVRILARFGHEPTLSNPES